MCTNLVPQALQCVSEAAVERLKVLVNCMLDASPAGVLDRMLTHHPSFGIFGREHVVSGEGGSRAVCDPHALVQPTPCRGSPSPAPVHAWTANRPRPHHSGPLAKRADGVLSEDQCAQLSKEHVFCATVCPCS